MPALRKTYPTSFGDKRASVMTLVGPASYTQFTAPSTGGQDVQAEPQSGVKVVDYAQGGSSDDGTHRVEVVHYEASLVRGVSVADTAFVVKWYVIATGAEVGAGVDMSGQTVRLLVIGEK